jgi:hypothetical protein
MSQRDAILIGLAIAVLFATMLFGALYGLVVSVAVLVMALLLRYLGPQGARRGSEKKPAMVVAAAFVVSAVVALGLGTVIH